MNYAPFIGIALVAYVVIQWGKTAATGTDWKSAAAKLPMVGGLFSDGKPSRADAQAALDLVIAFYENEGCPEGADAARIAGQHFYHPHKPDTAKVQIAT